jgi:hypothetical protein
MLRNLWKNQFEFYPYIAIFLIWLSTMGSSFLVKNRPGIVTLGLITIPSVVLLIIAVIKTIIELQSNQN